MYVKLGTAIHVFQFFRILESLLTVCSIYTPYQVLCMEIYPIEPCQRPDIFCTLSALLQLHSYSCTLFVDKCFRFQQQGKSGV